jgi:phosphoglycolate phosphatase-like HAD superfamily hydrolase
MGGAEHAGAFIIRSHTITPLELLRRLRHPAPPVAGLLLDVGGVLYDDTVWARWLLKLVTRLGLHTSYTPFFRLWQREYVPRIRRGELDYWQALRLFLRAAGLSNGQLDEVEAAGHARRRACETEILPLPGVAHTLARLRTIGVRLSICSTDCLDETGVRHQLDRLGIATYFEHVVADADAAWCMRGGLDAAIAATGIAPAELCYVGRDAEALREARAAGLRTVAINHDEDAEADIYLAHFQQLLESLPWRNVRAKAG